MRVGIFYYGTNPKDRGLGQLSSNLRRLGHFPLILHRNAGDSGKIAVENFLGTKVASLPEKRFKYINKYLTLPVPFNPFWKKWIKGAIIKQSFDCLFVRESPLASHILDQAAAFNIPVYLDIRENLTEMYASGRKVNTILRPSKLIKSYEYKLMKKFGHIFASTEELKRWLATAYGVDPCKISVTPNYPSKEFLDEAGLITSSGEVGGSFLRLIHLGALRENHGLQDIFQALSLLKRQGIDDFSFKIIGGGPYLNSLKEISRKLELERHVSFVPFLSPERLPEAIASCNIGICSFLIAGQAHLTLPGKLFEYMALGLPIISSSRETVKKIIDTHECGLIYFTRDPEEISQKIRYFVDNPTEIFRMGRNGFDAVRTRFNQDSNLETIRSVIGSGT